MNSLFKILTCCAILAAMTGCASITGDRSQQVRIETYDQSGNQVPGASCKLANDYGQVSVTTPDYGNIHRSSVNLRIDCAKPGYADASAVATSRANMNMYGNIIIGGGIGALIDHSNGSAYTYPKWMNLVFGQSLSFDRRNEVEGQPVVASQMNGQQSVPAATVSASQAMPERSAPVPATAPAPATVSASTPVAPVAATQAPAPGAYKIQTIDFVTGTSSTTVEKIAREYGCNGGKGAGLITPAGPVEIYRMQCESGQSFLARCELRQCKAM
ncbi:hypothetical protein [Undibacterium sp. RuTC16W]|uniref:hypothetical protein n=1 Tax=Undibacterium sp. RuTC16W TaxID=3413048 RepID=UPI003BF16AE2